MKVIAWEYSSLYSHSLPLGAFMQMPLAAKSNERQLCSQAMKVSDGIFLPLTPLCLVVTETKLHYTVKPYFAGIRSTWKPHYNRQFSLSWWD